MRIKHLFCQLGVFFVGFFFINELLAFDVPLSDKSRQYLGMIFGGSVGPIVLSDEHNIVIGKLFSQLNTVVFVLGTLMVGYITVVSTLNTAKEGHAMGQKWSSMWIPVRAVLGLLVMVPTPVSGYSTIQVTVMFFVLQGIGAANSVWQVALDAIGSGLTVTAVKGYGKDNAADLSLTGTQQAQLDQILQGSFQAAMCSKFVNRFVEVSGSADGNLILQDYNNSANTGGGQVSFYMDPSASNKINIGFDGGATNVNGVDFSKICGSATIRCHNADGTDGACTDTSKIATIYAGLNSVYQSMLDVAEPFFTAIDTLPAKPVSADYVSWAFNLGTSLGTDTGLYETQLGTLKSTILGMSPPVSDSKIQSTIAGAKSLGWIHAGSYYMTLNNLASAIVNNGDFILMGGASASDPTYGVVNSKLNDQAEDYIGYRKTSDANIKTMLTNLSSDLQTSSNYNPIYGMMVLSSSASKVSNSSQISKFFNKVLIGSSAIIPHQSFGGTVVTAISTAANAARGGISATSAIATFQGWINKATDPLLGISMFGLNLMNTAEKMVVIAFAASLVMSLGSLISCPVSLASFVNTAISGIMFPVMSTAILLWSTGAAFAVYIPMIPYLMFTATAVGWMFAVIESIVAAPILALGFVSPSGDEMGKAGQGVLMLVSLFMRPTLMILGFILASRLLKAVLTMVNNMFAVTIDANIAGVSSMFGWVVPMLLYASFVISLTNKCFSLIHILPEKVMRWIGAQGDGFSVEDVMQQTKSKQEEGVQAVQGIQKGVSESAQKKFADTQGGKKK